MFDVLNHSASAHDCRRWHSNPVLSSLTQTQTNTIRHPLLWKKRVAFCNGIPPSCAFAYSISNAMSSSHNDHRAAKRGEIERPKNVSPTLQASEYQKPEQRTRIEIFSNAADAQILQTQEEFSWVLCSHGAEVWAIVTARYRLIIPNYHTILRRLGTSSSDRRPLNHAGVCLNREQCNTHVLYISHL